MAAQWQTLRAAACGALHGSGSSRQRHSAGGSANEGTRTPLHRLGVNPANRLVEITAFDSALVRTGMTVHGKSNDHKGPVIRGITFTQYAYRALEVEGKKRFTAADEPTDEPVGPSDHSTYGKEVTGTVLENVSITYCSRVAGYFRGDGLIIRNSLVSDTSTEGIYVIGSSDVLLEKNIIRRNNVEQLTGYYPSAVKIFNQSYRVTVRDNLVLDNPNSSGVWYDVGNRDGVFVNNYVENAVNGFFFEISRGATVAGNVFVRCDRGIYILNAAGARIYNNTFLDAPASFERNQRSATGDHFGWHPATGPGVDQREGHVFVNNLLVANPTSRRPLLRFEQPAAMCQQLTRPQAAEVNGNVYVRASMPGVAAPPMVTWSPTSAQNCSAVATSLDEFRKVASQFEVGGQQLDQTPGSVLQGPDVQRFELRGVAPEGAWGRGGRVGGAVRTATPCRPTSVGEVAGWARTPPPPEARRRAVRNVPAVMAGR
ncbi:MAG: right-handed parallel beta-helix repeat-containing protein [Bryobacterales bacterium]|nr:right-handed parallel beta-helix repeat-containing protein [Bryobacterales bacterium]